MTAALRAAAMRALAELDVAGVRARSHRARRQARLPRARAARVTTVIKGDASCLAVAAASCVAKVTRDGMMRDAAEHYPPYDFESNVGYPAPAHKAALAGYGPSAIHRRSWIFMEALCWRGVPPAPGRLFVLIRRRVEREAGDGRRPSGGARRSLDASRRFVAGVVADQWETASVCDDWTVRELVNHIVTGNYWAAELGRRQDDRGGRRPARRRRARHRPAARLRRLRAGRGRGVPRAGCDGRAVRGVVRAGARLGVLRAPLHRRADPRVGRREVDRAGHQRSIPSSWKRAGRWSSRSSRCSTGSGAFGTPVDVPDGADQQTRLLAVLGRKLEPGCRPGERRAQDPAAQ